MFNMDFYKYKIGFLEVENSVIFNPQVSGTRCSGKRLDKFLPALQKKMEGVAYLI